MATINNEASLAALPQHYPATRGSKTTGEPRILQVFNRYMHRGGEEMSVERIYGVIARRYTMARCGFSSTEWTRKGGPPKLVQAARTFYNPEAIRKVLTCSDSLQANIWLFHNIFPVGSASLYREALVQKMPVLYYCHNFRPFSVSGYLWNGKRVATEGAKLNFWPEIRSGVWQNSRIKTLYLACVFWMMHFLGWWKAITIHIAISAFMRDFLLDAGIPNGRIHVLRHFWEPRDVQEQPEKGYYLFLGRLIGAKGVEVLLEAWRILFSRLGDETPPLVIAGQGPLEEKLRAHNQPGVRYVGFKSGKDKDELISGCRAMIAPSIWWEPLGLVTYEAYEFSKPMLAARSGGLTETVVEGTTGLLHTPGDAAEIAAQVMDLEKEPQRAAHMGAAGRQWLAAHTRREDWLRGFDECVRRALELNRRDTQ